MMSCEFSWPIKKQQQMGTVDIKWTSWIILSAFVCLRGEAYLQGN